jgi:hypothetical protein
MEKWTICLFLFVAIVVGTEAAARTKKAGKLRKSYEKFDPIQIEQYQIYFDEKIFKMGNEKLKNNFFKYKFCFL